MELPALRPVEDKTFSDLHDYLPKHNITETIR